MRQYLHSGTLKTLYYSFFLPYINYYYLGIYICLLEPLYLLQKKAISPPRTCSKTLFLKLNILSLHSLYKFHVSCFVFSHFNRLLPASLSSLLHFNRDFQGYLTRSCFNLLKMSVRYQFAISSQALIIWNDIPLTVRDSLTTTNFKKKLKLHFLSMN